MAGDLAFWQETFASYGWAACPLAFGRLGEFVTDDPAAAAASGGPPRQLSLGVPHPQYGVMRATVIVTDAGTLTRAAGIAHESCMTELGCAEGLPTLYVGSRPFRDVVGDRECMVLGVLVFAGPLLGVQYAPLTVTTHDTMWLPLFEDCNGWVMTGWDAVGRVAEIHKPFGWRGAGLPPPAVSSCQSNAPTPTPEPEPEPSLLRT